MIRECQEMFRCKDIVAEFHGQVGIYNIGYNIGLTMKIMLVAEDKGKDWESEAADK